MKNMDKRGKSSLIIFMTIALWYAVGNFVWWHINTPIIPLGVQALHLNTVFLKQNLFMNAPLLTWIMRFMFFVFGTENYDLTVIFVNYIFFLIPLYFTYKIAAELKDKQAGNIAMILFALVPAIYGMSRQYGHQDYHIVAGITFNIFCLMKADFFRNRKWSVIYGLSTGLGLLIKDPFLAYFFMPFAFCAVYGLIKEKDSKTIKTNIFLSVLFAVLTAGCHYFRPEIIKKVWYDNHSQTVRLLDFENTRAMTTGLWEELLSPPVFILFAVGLVWFILRYRNKYKNIILLWFFVPWLGIIFMGHYKIAEYGLGFVPAAAVVGALWVSNIRRRFVKIFIIAVVAITGLLQYADFSYGLNFKMFGIKTRIKGNDIKYYGRDNKMIKLKREEIDALQRLGMFLKNNYSGYVIGFSDLLEYPDYDAMRLQMNLRGVKFIYIKYYVDLLERGMDPKKFVDFMSEADVLLYPDITKEQILKFNYKRMDFFPFLYENITKQRQIDGLNKVFKLRDGVFCRIDSFNIRNKNKSKIILLGKRDKFDCETGRPKN